MNESLILQEKRIKKWGEIEKSHPSTRSRKFFHSNDDCDWKIIGLAREDLYLIRPLSLCRLRRQRKSSSLVSLVEEERVLHTFGDEQSYKNIFNDYYMYEVYYLFFRYV